MRAAREPTKGTEIASLEAQRNELEVRAMGALVGERRSAIARLAMVAMFGAISELADPHHSASGVYVGIAYTTFAVGFAIGVWTRKRANSTVARWLPIATTLVDFGFISAEEILQSAHNQFQPGQFAVGTLIVMSFSIARMSAWHVAFSLACAEAAWIACTVHAGVATAFPTWFVECGLVVAGLLLVMTNRVIGSMFHGLRQRDNLTRFLPRQVAERVIAAGPGALAPVDREVTVLFSDIRGFTGLSEGLAPREVLAMLDDYFGRMGQVVKGHDGVIGKFLGDGLLAFWGVPDRVGDHALRAVRAARDMRRELVELNRHRELEGKPAIKIGIGIHTGNVAAGMLGGQLQSEYTIIGDAVNVASRIEGLTKEHAVDVLISETTWAQLGDGIPARRVGDAPIRGRKEPVVLYALDER
ncbi:MAG TPA: adenylate/guanylate cyclase domain-containing protein [Kofleriaceae bacterium]|nr:adenylate/guanylate cyclase domain-containing protein [Kofleriaceae bacterium]